MFLGMDGRAFTQLPMLAPLLCTAQHSTAQHRTAQHSCCAVCQRAFGKNRATEVFQFHMRAIAPQSMACIHVPGCWYISASDEVPPFMINVNININNGNHTPEHGMHPHFQALVIAWQEVKAPLYSVHYKHHLYILPCSSPIIAAPGCRLRRLPL